MYRSVFAMVGLLSLAAPAPAFALGGELQATESARLNALAGGPVSARDASYCNGMGAIAELAVRTAMALTHLRVTIERLAEHIVGNRATSNRRRRLKSSQTGRISFPFRQPRFPPSFVD